VRGAFTNTVPVAAIAAPGFGEPPLIERLVDVPAPEHEIGIAHAEHCGVAARNLIKALPTHGDRKTYDSGTSDHLRPGRGKPTTGTDLNARLAQSRQGWRLAGSARPRRGVVAITVTTTLAFASMTMAASTSGRGRIDGPGPMRHSVCKIVAAHS